MYTFFDYLQMRGDLTLKASPFNEIDAAILARMVYEPFEGIVSDDLNDKMTLSEVMREILNIPDLEERVLDKQKDPVFIGMLMESPRFRDMTLKGFVHTIDEERQTQFAALVIDLNDELEYYVAFRGTDNTLIGWKEDFNMGYEFPVPAQHMAKDYLENVIRKFKDGTFIVGGHSKGGNLSIYSSAFIDPMCQKAIDSIYNFDGPGFTEKLIHSPEYLEIKGRIRSFVPQFSVVGMILEHEESYKAVRSDANMIMQHEMFSWEIYRDRFVCNEDVDPASKYIDKTLEEWLNGVDKEEREQFVDALYQILTGGELKTLNDINRNKFEAFAKAVKSYGGLNENTKKGLNNTIMKLFESAGNVLKPAIGIEAANKTEAAPED